VQLDSTAIGCIFSVFYFFIYLACELTVLPFCFFLPRKLRSHSRWTSLAVISLLSRDHLSSLSVRLLSQRPRAGGHGGPAARRGSLGHLQHTRGRCPPPDANLAAAAARPLTSSSSLAKAARALAEAALDEAGGGCRATRGRPDALARTAPGARPAAARRRGRSRRIRGPRLPTAPGGST
jgi:hypothetical protein